MPAPRLIHAASLFPLLAACSADPTPSPSSALPSAAPVSIVGTWETDMGQMLGRTAGKAARLGKPEATDAEVDAVLEQSMDQMRAQGAVPRQIYRADGTGELSGLVFDHPIRDQFTWELVEATAERIVIDNWTESKVHSRMTFLVESPDVLVYADKPMKGVKIMRVK